MSFIGRERLFLAAVSLALAVLLWMTVVGEKEREWTYSVPVEVKPGSSEVIAQPRPERVSVLVRGPRRIMDRIPVGEIHVRLVLADNPIGERNHALEPSMLAGIPAGLEIIRIEPSEVRVEIQPLKFKNARVSPRLHLPPGSTFRLKEPVPLDPEVVEVKGTGASLKDVTVVMTEEVEVGQEPGLRTIELPLIAPAGTRVFPLSVRAMVTILPTDTPAAPREP